MGKDIPLEQLMAINMRFRLGKEFQEKYGEKIKSLYSNGYSLSKIVEELDIHEDYNISEHLAKNSIYTAITGHDGKFHVKGYDGLFSDEEREKIGKEHIIQNGHRQYKEGKGIHGLTLERKIEICRKLREDGKGIECLSYEERSDNGKKLHESGKGIHGLSAEEKSENGIKGAIARGYTPWSDEEKERLYELSQQEEYRNGKYTKCKDLSIILNNEFHEGKEIRKNNTVSLCLLGIRREKENLEEKLK